MKILITRIAGGFGGAEIYNLNLVGGIRKYFPESRVFFITNLPEFAKELEKQGARVFVLRVWSGEIGTKKDLFRFLPHFPQYLFYFLKTIFSLKKEKINLVCFQGTTEKLILTPIFRIFRLPVVWLEHGPFFAFKKAEVVKICYKWASRMAKKIITVSRDSKKDLEKNGIKKVISVWTGISGKKEHKKLKRNELVVGFSGAICWEKGIRDFIEVAFVIKERIKNIKFLLVGDGPELSWAKEAVKVLGMEKNFVFAGWQKNVVSFLGQMDVFFFPTRHLEGLSLALLEAMAGGIPIVARDIGGNRELVVNGKTGYLFKEETPEKVAEIIVKLLKDKKKRGAMGRAARERVEKYFSEERWIKKLHKVFEEVAKG
jgi:glycosyltransferase involved in cell wall biosynthesis